MKKLLAAGAAALLVLLSACGEAGQKPPAQEREPEPAGQTETQEIPPPSPLTVVDVTDKDVEYAVVPAVVEELFRYELGGLAHQWFLVGDVIALYAQQDTLTLLDKAGHTIAHFDILGKSVQSSRNHFAVIDEYGATVYHQDGREAFAIDGSGLNGLIQSLVVSPDGSVAAFTSEDDDGYRYLIHLYDSASRETKAVTARENGVDSFSYRLSGISDDGRYVYGEGDLVGDPYGPPAMVVCDTESARVVATVPQSMEQGEEGEYRYPFQGGTASGVLLSVENVYDMQMGFPTVWGEMLYSATGQLGGQLYRLDPYAKTGEVGYFPLYSYSEMGIEEDGSAIIYYFDNGDCVIARVSLEEGSAEKPSGQIDLSRESLDAVLGQKLSHRGGGWGAYRLLSAVVTNYVDTFGDAGFALSDETPDIENRLFSSVLFLNYGTAGLPERLAPYTDGDDTGIYHIPRAVGEQWVEGLFGPLLDGVEWDLRKHGAYNPELDSLDYFGGYGWGAEDYVYLEQAAYEGNLLDLTAVVIPYDYLYRGDGIERVRITALYDETADAFTYQSAQRIDS